MCVSGIMAAKSLNGSLLLLLAGALMTLNSLVMQGEQIVIVVYWHCCMPKWKWWKYPSLSLSFFSLSLSLPSSLSHKPRGKSLGSLTFSQFCSVSIHLLWRIRATNTSDRQQHRQPAWGRATSPSLQHHDRHLPISATGWVYIANRTPRTSSKHYRILRHSWKLHLHSGLWFSQEQQHGKFSESTRV